MRAADPGSVKILARLGGASGMMRKLMWWCCGFGLVLTVALYVVSLFRVDVYIPKTARMGVEYGCIDWDTRYASATTYKALLLRNKRQNYLLSLTIALDREQNRPNPKPELIEQIQRLMDDLHQKMAAAPKVYDKWHWNWKGYDGFAVAVTPFYYSKPLRIILPLWLPVLLFGAIPVALVTGRSALRRHRLTKGLCLACGYDLRGSTAACPECGQMVNRQA